MASRKASGLTAASATCEPRDRALGWRLNPDAKPNSADFQLADHSGASGERSNAEKRSAVLDCIANYPTATDREVARRCGVSHPFVGKLRAAVTRAVSSDTGQGSASPGNGAVAATHTAGKGAPTALEPPGLLRCWLLATPSERRQFVDAVSLKALYEMAPADHQAAFLAHHWCELERKPDIEPSPGMQVYISMIEQTAPGEVPGIPAFLIREAPG